VRRFPHYFSSLLLFLFIFRILNSIHKFPDHSQFEVLKSVFSECISTKNPNIVELGFISIVRPRFELDLRVAEYVDRKFNIYWACETLKPYIKLCSIFYVQPSKKQKLVIISTCFPFTKMIRFDFMHYFIKK
jgi:hypothetical protein